MILSKSKESLVEDPFESDLFKRFFREQAILLNRDLSLNQAIFSKEVLSKAIPSKTISSKAILSKVILSKTILSKVILSKPKISYYETLRQYAENCPCKKIHSLLPVTRSSWIGLESRLQMRDFISVKSPANLQLVSSLAECLRLKLPD